MPKKKYSLVASSSKRGVRPIDTTRSLSVPFLWAMLLSCLGALAISAPMAVKVFLHQGGEGGLLACWLPLSFVLYVPSLSVVTYFMYGTKQLIFCAILLKTMESNLKHKKALARIVFGFIVRLYRVLGKYTASEEVEGVCYTTERYQEFVGQRKRGEVAQRVEILSNKHFYESMPKSKYATLRRLFKELAEKGASHFRTKEHVYFETTM